MVDQKVVMLAEKMAALKAESTAARLAVKRVLKTVDWRVGN